MATNHASAVDHVIGIELAREYALTLGIILTILGILGFIPIVAPHGYIFTVFANNPVYNFLYLATGLAGIGIALTTGEFSHVFAPLYALVIGVIYGVMTILGFITGRTVVDIIPANLGTNLLNLVITVTALAVFIVSTTAAVRRTRDAGVTS